MSDAPFDRTNIGLRERPVSGDLNQIQGQLYRAIMHQAGYMLAVATNASSAAQPKTGFMHDGCRVVPSSPMAMSVVVTPGFGVIYDPSDLPTGIGATDLEKVDDLSPFKPAPLVAPVTFAVPAAPGSPNSRIDIIEVRTARRLGSAVTRRQLDSLTEEFVDHLFFKSLEYTLDGQTGVVSSPTASTAALSYKVGVAGNPGLVPATTPGYTKIAEILVPTGTTSIGRTNIVDRRPVLNPAGVVMASARFSLAWVASGGDPNIGTTTVTLFSVTAPPGVEFAFDITERGVRPAGSQQRAQVVVHVFGGEIASASSLFELTNLGFTNVVGVREGLSVTGGYSNVDAPPYVTTATAPLTATQQAALIASGSTAPGVGQSTAMVAIQGRDLGSSVTWGPTSLSNDLNTVQLEVRFALRY